MRPNFNLLVRGLTLCAAFLFFMGCNQDEVVKPIDNQSLEPRGLGAGGGFGGAVVKNVYGLTDKNELLLIRTGPPATVLSTVLIAPLGDGEFILAIDYRTNGQLYGVSSFNMVYRIDPISGKAIAISRGPFEPGLKGELIGMDFDPALDQIRIVTDADQNMRLHPTQGNVVMVDKDIDPASTDVNAIAYGFNVSPGARTFPLYDIDVARGWLVRQNPANDGTISPIGSMGMVISGEGGFDISRNAPSAGYAVLYGHTTTPLPPILGGDNLHTDAYRIWEVNLQSGKITNKGKVPRNVIGLAIP